MPTSGTSSSLCWLTSCLFADMIERAIINTLVGRDVVEPGNYVQMFPYPCYTRDE